MTVELRDREAAERYLAGGLCLARVGAPGPDDLAEAAPWLVAALAEAPALPPPAVVADVGRLLAGRSLDGARELPSGDLRLRQAVRSYEDQVLGRLAGDPHLDAAADAAARLPDGLRPQAVALLVGRLLHRVGFAAGAALPPGIARRLLARPAAEIQRDGLTALRRPDLAADLAAGYEALVAAAQRARALLSEAEVFTLENLEVLGASAQRVAIEQIVEAAADLARALPRRLKRRPRSLGGRAPTQLEEESAYPIGGFSSITTSGAIENLVSSELIYMDDPGEIGDGVDLFDMRYVEGELLYYSRDEAILVRQRRAIVFALAPDLADLRYKEPDLPWQRLVAALGLVVAAVRKLTEWLSEEALSFRVVFLRGGAPDTPLAAERGLVELCLREWRDKGTAEIAVADDLDAVLADARASARRALTDVIVVGARPIDPPVDPRVRVGSLALDGEPAIRWPRRPPPEAPAREPLAAFQATLLELLQELV